MNRLLIILWFLCVAIRAESQCNDLNFTTQDGEWLKYSACYNWHFIWLNAGSVVFSTEQIVWNGEPAYKFKTIGQTYRSYDFFYTVRDTFEVITDTLTLSPFRFVQKNYEGKSITRNLYEYSNDVLKLKGWSEVGDAKKSTKKNLDLSWAKCSFDVLTMVYKTRNINFDSYAVGTKIPINLIINGESFDLYIRYLGRETITTRYGRKFRCLKISPLLVEGTIFNGGEDMTVWISDDQSRVPIMVEAKILIGSVKAVFLDAGCLRHPMDSEIIEK